MEKKYMNKKTLLSICIPTYNRAWYLEKCLKSIVSQDGFENIEIVISDNCSCDNTEHIGREYDSLYNNVHYFRNDKNLGDLNFPLAFQRASGILRKLTNDTVIYKPGAIKYMLNVVKENVENKPQVYFLSKGSSTTDSKTIISLDDYIVTLSYNLTWICPIAIWEDDCEDLEIFVTNAESKLAQVPFLLNNFKKRGCAILYDHEIMNIQNVQKKNLSYGLYKVFYETFLDFIKPYVDKGELSSASFEILRKDLLLNFFRGWVMKTELETDKYIFSEENLRDLVERAYKDEPYFGEYKKKLRRLIMKKKIKGVIKKIVNRFEFSKQIK